jgi:5'-3' exonuclease
MGCSKAIQTLPRKRITLQEGLQLGGARVAIIVDFSSVFFRHLLNHAFQLAADQKSRNPSQNYNHIVKNITHDIDRNLMDLRGHGPVILVFDGMSFGKEGENARRQDRREKARKEFEKCFPPKTKKPILRRLLLSRARRAARNMVHWSTNFRISVYKELIASGKAIELRKWLEEDQSSLSIATLVSFALGEGDQGCSAVASLMNKMNYTPIVLSNDSDILFLPNIDQVLFGIDWKTGICTRITRAQLNDHFKLSSTQLMAYAILCGTDYGKNIRNAGPAKALKAVRETTVTDGTLDIIAAASAKLAERTRNIDDARSKLAGFTTAFVVWNHGWKTAAENVTMISSGQSSTAPRVGLEGEFRTIIFKEFSETIARLIKSIESATIEDTEQETEIELEQQEPTEQQEQSERDREQRERMWRRNVHLKRREERITRMPERGGGHPKYHGGIHDNQPRPHYLTTLDYALPTPLMTDTASYLHKPPNDNANSSFRKRKTLSEEIRISRVGTRKKSRLEARKFSTPAGLDSLTKQGAKDFFDALLEMPNMSEDDATFNRPSSKASATEVLRDLKALLATRLDVDTLSAFMKEVDGKFNKEVVASIKKWFDIDVTKRKPPPRYASYQQSTPTTVIAATTSTSPKSTANYSSNTAASSSNTGTFSGSTATESSKSPMMVTTLFGSTSTIVGSLLAGRERHQQLGWLTIEDITVLSGSVSGVKEQIAMERTIRRHMVSDIFSVLLPIVVDSRVAEARDILTVMVDPKFLRWLLHVCTFPLEDEALSESTPTTTEQQGGITDAQLLGNIGSYIQQAVSGTLNLGENLELFKAWRTDDVPRATLQTKFQRTKVFTSAQEIGLIARRLVLRAVGNIEDGTLPTRVLRLRDKVRGSMIEADAEDLGRDIVATIGSIEEKMSSPGETLDRHVGDVELWVA